MKGAWSYVNCRFIHSYTADEIHFNLLAVVSDRRMCFEREISEIETKKELAAQKVNASATDSQLNE